MSVNYNLYVDQGTDLDTTVNIAGMNNQPVDISDYTFVSKAVFIKNPKIQTNIEISLVEDETKSKIKLKIPADVTKDLAPGDWDYDVMMKKDDTVSCILRGKLIVIDTVSLDQVR